MLQPISSRTKRHNFWNRRLVFYGSYSELFFSLLVGCLLTVISCQNPLPPHPRQLVVGINADPQNLDPRYGLDAGSLRCYQLMYNGLFRLDEQAKVVPDLALTVQMENSTSYIVELRRGILFHNGKEMCAHDVKYTFDSILDDRKGSPLRQRYQILREIQVEGPYKVRFLLKEPYAPFLSELAQPIIAAPDSGTGWDDKGVPPGTGPFMLENRRVGQYILFKCHQRYFRGRPFMDRVVFKITADDTTRFLQLKRGELDFVQNGLTPEMIPLVQKDPRFTVMRGEGSNYAYLGFNLKDPILSNRKVRMAIACALNVPEMITYLMGGYARPSTGLLYPGNWAYEAHVPRFDYDLERAGRLLDEAGYKRLPVRFKLTYKTTQTEVSLRKAQYIQAQLQRIGIQVEIRSYEWSTFFADIRTGNFQFYSLEWVGISDPDIYYHLFHSKSVPPGGANRGGYVNPVLDNLLESARRELDPSRRAALYSEIQKILAYDLPYISLWHGENIVVMKKDLIGYRLHPSGDISSLWQVRRTSPSASHK
jgi:peptide/nickel transport system substrate-binding protein